MGKEYIKGQEMTGHLDGCQVTQPCRICTCGYFHSLGANGTRTKEQNLHWHRLYVLNRVYTLCPMNRTKAPLHELLGPTACQPCSSFHETVCKPETFADYNGIPLVVTKFEVKGAETPDHRM